MKRFLALAVFVVFILSSCSTRLKGDKQTAVIKIHDQVFTYEGQEAFDKATSSLSGDDYQHIVDDGIDYFIYAPSEKSRTAVMPVPVIMPARR